MTQETDRNRKLFSKIIFGILILLIIIGCSPQYKILEKKIQTRSGELHLKYENGTAVLSGTLSRATPCVEWQVKVNSGGNGQKAVFEIFDKNELKGMMCIQVLGKPQEIKAVSSASEKTKYSVIFEHQKVFSGELK